MQIGPTAMGSLMAGFDIEKYQPKLICVEAPAAVELLKEYFAEHDYKRIDKYLKYDFGNWYYTPVGSDARSAPE